jgi:hypothetical protein
MPACGATHRLRAGGAPRLVLRVGSFYKKKFFTCQCVTALGVALVPLFMTNTPPAVRRAARKQSAL